MKGEIIIKFYTIKRQILLVNYKNWFVKLSNMIMQIVLIDAF